MGSGNDATLTIAVVDEIGNIHDRVRDLQLVTDIWRFAEPRRFIRSAPPVDRIVLAAYSDVDWELAGDLSRRSPLLVITTTYAKHEAEEALRWGLLGYLDVGLAAPAFGRAVRGALMGGEPGYSRDVIGTWLREMRASIGVRATVDGLTMRQCEILALIARGATDKEIAAELGIAVATAQKHVTNILKRLGVPNRAAAVAARMPVSGGTLRAFPDIVRRFDEAMEPAS